MSWRENLRHGVPLAHIREQLLAAHMQMLGSNIGGNSLGDAGFLSARGNDVVKSYAWMPRWYKQATNTVYLDMLGSIEHPVEFIGRLIPNCYGQLGKREKKISVTPC